jgi:hypothetical protein
MPKVMPKVMPFFQSDAVFVESDALDFYNSMILIRPSLEGLIQSMIHKKSK